jgi:ribA/ribD-fused uncharacterized protein
MSKEQFHFFYGGPFSNWASATFDVDGKKYHNSEQYMMAEKARLFGDKDAEAKIMQTSDPQKAKILGRNVRGFDKDKWNEKARDIVYKGCYAKFQQNKGLLFALNETKGKTLVEASPTDQIWGIGYEADSPKAKDRSKWRGTNWLGEVLTLVRDDLEAGIYRTSNFCWSGTVFNNDVTITNNTQTDLWIWDNDKMRRWAYDLKHDHPDVKEVEVIVSTNDQTEVVFTEVEVVAKKDGFNVSGKAGSRDSVLDAFQSALKKAKEALD